MILKRTISTIAILTVLSTILGILTILFFQDNFKSIILKLTCFLFYCSILLIGNLILISNTKSTSKVIVNIITAIDASLIILGLLILLDVLSFINFWHTILGISILYITSLQLNLLGWSQHKHAIINKIYFFLILCVNLFLAAIFFLKLNRNILDPFILIAVIISACFFVLGTYSASRKKDQLH